MSFTDGAVQLCGQCAILLGWRPQEFWTATPAELACIVRIAVAQIDAPPDPTDLQKLMKLFPDAPTGGE
jgi:Phage tail assembly chaperone protein, TAC